MSKAKQKPRKDKGTPLWKLVASLTASAVGSPLLFFLAFWMDQTQPETDDPLQGSRPLGTIPDFLIIVAAALGVLAVALAIWLGYRIRQASKPAWQGKLDKFGNPKR